MAFSEGNALTTSHLKMLAQRIKAELGYFTQETLTLKLADGSTVTKDFVILREPAVYKFTVAVKGDISTATKEFTIKVS